MRFQFIHKQKNKYSVKILSRLLDVSRQGYYDWRSRKPSNTKLRHQYLEGEIKRVFKEHKGRYGSPRIAMQLYEEGIETNKRVVAALMRKMGLCAKGYHPRRATYGQPKPIETAVKENLLNREFTQEVIDAVWVTDITYINCSDGRLYLSTYIDLATRIPRCFSVKEHMRKSIVIEPIEKHRGQMPEVTHSDQGSQYRSYAYQELLEKQGITHSMSEAGTPVDNAVVESYHRSIKRELIYPNKHKSKAEMRVLIDDYLNDYYVNKRIHTKLGMTPKRFEEKLLASSN